MANNIQGSVAGATDASGKVKVGPKGIDAEALKGAARSKTILTAGPGVRPVPMQTKEYVKSAKARRLY